MSIHADGTLTYGEGYTPDEAAVALWEAIARRRLEVDRRLEHINLMELHIALLAVADRAYEVAQVAARAETATEVERFREELSRRDLEVRVHGIIEFAREYADRRPDLIAMARRARPGG